MSKIGKKGKIEKKFVKKMETPISSEDDFLSFRNGLSTDNEPFDPEKAVASQ